jgi:predicted HNH restriction endonuclease
MDERLARNISNMNKLEELSQLEENAKARDALSEELKAAIKSRTAVLGRAILAEKTGLPLTNLSSAEEKIVQAIGEYVGIQKREGKSANRTLMQVRNRGLIGAAETSVSKSKQTQGFTVLTEANLEELSYEKIIVDHPEEFSARALWYARRTLGMTNDSATPPTKDASNPTDNEPTEKGVGRNPSWSRDELIMALDLYLRSQSMPAKDSQEIAELVTFLRSMRGSSSEAATYRNANGVYMKMMNFRRFDPDYTLDGRVGLVRGNKEEETVWADFSSEPVRLAAAVADIRARIENGELTAADKNAPAVRSGNGTPYWVFVCNPKKWAIDRFLDRRVEQDTWGVRPSDRDRFAPGQLGIIRVGVDRRTVAERNGGPVLEAGIYALCEVESTAFPAAGANDEFWAPGEAREAGWPTIRLRYLRTFLDKPLTITKLRMDAPDVSSLLLDGFQAASFPIPASDFHKVVNLLGADPDELLASSAHDDVDGEKLSAVETKYLHASPEVKNRIAKVIERGSVGKLVKRLTGFKCQICEALGNNPMGFAKKNGEPYVEAHHVMPVSTMEIGTLAASNIMTLCANHHRQMHFGEVTVAIMPTTFELVIGERHITIARLSIDPDALTSELDLSKREEALG